MAIYNRADMPRPRPSEASQERRDVLGINGPPFLSLGFQVESSKPPATLVYILK